MKIVLTLRNYPTLICYIRRTIVLEKKMSIESRRNVTTTTTEARVTLLHLLETDVVARKAVKRSAQEDILTHPLSPFGQ